MSKNPSILLLSLTLLIASSSFRTQIAFAQGDLRKDQEASQESTISNIKKVIQDKQVELGQNGKENRPSRQAYLAQVKRVSAETLTLKNNKGSRIVPLSSDLLIYKGDQVVGIDRIVVDDWVVVYGVLEADTFVAKRIEITGKDFTQETRQVLLGSITEIYQNNISLIPRSSEEKFSFALTKNTRYLDVTGKTARINDFYEDLQCLVIVRTDQNGKMTVSSIKALIAF